MVDTCHARRSRSIYFHRVPPLSLSLFLVRSRSRYFFFKFQALVSLNRSFPHSLTRTIVLSRQYHRGGINRDWKSLISLWRIADRSWNDVILIFNSEEVGHPPPSPKLSLNWETSSSSSSIGGNQILFYFILFLSFLFSIFNIETIIYSGWMENGQTRDDWKTILRIVTYKKIEGLFMLPIRLPIWTVAII